jgi:hypothetical protein
VSDRSKLGTFLKEVINWRWDEFCKAEIDSSYTGIQSTVFSLIRTCSDGKLGAIRLSIDRVDGKIETPVSIVYPKVYFVYPNATSIAELPFGESTETHMIEGGSDPETHEVPPKEENDAALATLSLRQTLNKMADQPRVLVKAILDKKRETEESIRDHANMDPNNIPMVKSVIAANLLHLAEKNNFEAITEVFDQIDGKLVETIHILGDDIYLTQYALEAPAGSVKNDDGVYMLDAKEVADRWKQKFKAKS